MSAVYLGHSQNFNLKISNYVVIYNNEALDHLRIELYFSISYIGHYDLSEH